jgi:hypothetical protein
MGNSANPSAWAKAPVPKSITIRRGGGVGGSDRIELIFADRSIVNRWLQITMLANSHTGLAKADVFYFGNLMGESGNSITNAAVNTSDVSAALAHASAIRAAITSVLDFNRDGVINSADVLAARGNQGNALILLAAPALVAPKAVAQPTLAAPPPRPTVAAPAKQTVSLFSSAAIVLHSAAT